MAEAKGSWRRKVTAVKWFPGCFIAMKQFTAIRDFFAMKHFTAESPSMEARSLLQDYVSFTGH
jgi:hypothetical protein